MDFLEVGILDVVVLSAIVGLLGTLSEAGATRLCSGLALSALVHLAYHGVELVDGSVNGCDGAVNRCAETDHSVAVGAGYVHECRCELDMSLPVESWSLSEMHGKVIRIACIYILPYIRSDKETLVEEDTLIPLLAVWCGSFSVEMMEAQVLYIACVGSAAKRLYENVRHARDTAQVDMAVRSDMADSFVCCHESDVCHLS